MPINISRDLPAYDALLKENVFMITNERASSQDIRPIRVLIVNIMPLKIETEVQLLRLLANTPIQVDITLTYPSSHIPKNTPSKHLKSFYRPFTELVSDNFDGMIITGAPVEHLEFEQVTYWRELCEIMEWAKKHVVSSMFICWGAIAGLHYYHGIRRQGFDIKISGVYESENLAPTHVLMRGIDDRLIMPHSRYAGVFADDVIASEGVQILSRGEHCGVTVAADSDNNYFILGHPEYETETLGREYSRDLEKGLDICEPLGYFGSGGEPRCRWRAHSTLLFANWLNYCVYQVAPYDISKIPYTYPHMGVDWVMNG